MLRATVLWSAFAAVLNFGWEIAQWLVPPALVFLLTRLTLQRWETSDSSP